MTAKTPAQLKAEAASSFPDNTVGAITPAIMRTFQGDIIDSYSASQTINAAEFGAVGDGVTDDTSAIQAALNAAGVQVSGLSVSGQVCLGAGVYIITNTIYIPDKVSLKGIGKRSTSIKANGSFPGATTLVMLGKTTDTFAFDCYLEDLTVDGTTPANSTAVESTKAQEGSGLRSVLAIGRSACLYFNGSGCDNVYNRDVELFGGTYCLRQRGAGSGAYYKVSAIGGLVGATTACIDLDSTALNGNCFHCETATDGVLIGSNVSGVLDSLEAGISPNNITNLVHYAGAALISVRGITLNGATNSVTSDNLSLSYTDDFVEDTRPLFFVTNGTTRAAAFSVTLGGSTVAYTNPKITNVMFIIQGGTVSKIEIFNRSAVWVDTGITAGVIYLAPGDAFRVTYSLIPNVTGIPM